MIMHIKEKQKISVLIPNFNDSEKFGKNYFFNRQTKIETL